MVLNLQLQLADIYSLVGGELNDAMHPLSS